MTTPNTPTATTDVATLVRSAYDLFARGDIPAVLELIDPEVEWIEAEGGPFAGTYRGPQAVLEGVFGRIGSEWENFVVQPETVVAQGDTVIAVGTYRGTYRATSKPMEARFAHVWEMSDGRLRRLEQIADSAMLNAAMR